MKRVGRAYRWFLLSLILQVLLLCYLEFFYLNSSGSVKVTAYAPANEKPSNREIVLPQDASGIKVSNDGSYAAYLTEGNLEITDTKNNKNKKTLKREGWELTSFTWVPDRPMVAVAYVKSGKTSSVVITTYEMSTGVERSYPELKGLSPGSRVTGIELSPLTNIVYFKLKTSETKAAIYRFNIMDNMKRLLSIAPEAKFLETIYSENLIYESGGAIKVRSGKTGKTYTVPVKSRCELIGLDSEDKVYIGVIGENGKIPSVHYGDMTASGVDLEKVDLKEPVDPGNLLVSPDGMILEKVDKDNALYDTGTGKKYGYSGEFVQLLDNYIVSKAGRRLKLAVVKY